MADTRAGANRLHVASLGSPNVSDTVSMSDEAFTYIRDDFQIGVTVETEARPRGNLIVIPDHQCSKGPISRVTVRTYGKVVFGL
jgi:hypothetical protein